MKPPASLIDLRPGDTVVTLTDVRSGDLVRLERVDDHTIGLRTVTPGDAPSGVELCRVERHDGPASFRLVQVRATGPLN
jgi:hypothetical protein